MKYNSIKICILILAYLLVRSTDCVAESPQIISQDVQVNYISPTRMSPLQTKTNIKRKTPISHKQTQVTSVKPVQSIYSVKPTQSTQITPKSQSPSINQQKVTAKTTIMPYDNIYALSPYAKYLRLNSLIPATLPYDINLPWQDIIMKASLKYALSPELIAAVIKVESDFNVNVVSSKGAEGLMQIMPATQDYLNLHDPFNPELNIMAGSAYLREQLDAFGSEELALAAYNAGPGNVIKYKGVPPFNETQNYVVKVLRYKEKFAKP